MLRVYTGDKPPESVTQILGIIPSSFLVKGEFQEGKRKPAALNGWFLSSKDRVSSLDTRRHVDWLLNELQGKELELKTVIEQAKNVDVSCYWLSKSGHGGPALSVRQMEGLVKFN